MKKYFPTIKYWDGKIIGNFAPMKKSELVIGSYCDTLKRISILRGRTKIRRTILHELIHWFIFKLPLSKDRIEQLHCGHDRRSTYRTKWRTV